MIQAWKRRALDWEGGGAVGMKQKRQINMCDILEGGGCRDVYCENKITGN